MLNGIGQKEPALFRNGCRTDHISLMSENQLNGTSAFYWNEKKNAQFDAAILFSLLLLGSTPSKKKRTEPAFFTLFLQ